MSNDFENRPTPINKAIREVMSCYPNIDPKKIIYFFPAYYPIGIISVEIVERTFEDLPSVEEAILKFINIGINDIDRIAKLMSLSRRYVQFCFNDFNTNGTVKEGVLTELGMKSIKENKKIKQHTIIRDFKLNLLNGNILDDSTLITNNSFVDLNETKRFIGIIPFVGKNLIDKESVKKYIKDSNYIQKLHKYDNYISCNFIGINGVKYKETTYAKIYGILLESSEIPILFYEHLEKNSNRKKTNLIWKTFGIQEQSGWEFLGADRVLLPTEINTYKELAKTLGLVNRKIKKNDIRLLFDKEFYNYEGVHDIKIDNYGNVDCNVDSSFFKKYRTEMLYVLSDMGKIGYTYSLDDMYEGKVVRIKTKDKQIEVLANYINSFDNIHNVAKKIQGSMLGVHGDVIGKIYSSLKLMEK